MNELFPIATGLLVGTAAAFVGPRRHRAGWAALVALVVGFVAAFVSGELELSAAFLVLDTGQVLVATLGSYALARAVARRLVL
jgi:uncharacterized membrane protein YeaQ/YmgE (transglycosylase-associated protein family)